MQDKNVTHKLITICNIITILCFFVVLFCFKFSTCYRPISFISFHYTVTFLHSLNIKDYMQQEGFYWYKKGKGVLVGNKKGASEKEYSVDLSAINRLFC